MLTVFPFSSSGLRKKQPWVFFSRSKTNLTSARENNTSIVRQKNYIQRKSEREKINLNRYHNLECLCSDSLIKSMQSPRTTTPRQKVIHAERLVSLRETTKRKNILKLFKKGDFERRVMNDARSRQGQRRVQVKAGESR